MNRSLVTCLVIVLMVSTGAMAADTVYYSVVQNGQNRNEASYDNIIRHLQKGSPEDKLVGELMYERKGKVFPTGDAEPI